MDTIKLQDCRVWKYDNERRRELATRRAKVVGASLTCQRRKYTAQGLSEYGGVFWHDYPSAILAWQALHIFLKDGVPGVNNHRRSLNKGEQRPIRQHIEEARP
ncbi:MAG: hypothetical protein K2Q12_08205 [Rickettsiales bacterium]|nr:hypothetical protein [Rickettsiales bacterium]